MLFRIDKRKYKRDFKYCHYFKDVIELLTHPYIYQLDESISTQIILDINEKKKIDIKNEELSSYSIFLENVFDLQSNLILKLKRISRCR